MSELKGEEPTKKRKLYVKTDGIKISYKILSEDENIISGEITNDDLPEGVNIPEKDNLEQYNAIEDYILDVTFRREHSHNGFGEGVTFLHLAAGKLSKDGFVSILKSIAFIQTR